MDSFDEVINKWIQPTSVTAGIGTVLFTFFSGKIAPKMPEQFYKILDNPLTKIFITFFLLNQQIRKPTISLIIAIIFVIGVSFLVSKFVPESPPLSDLLRPEKETDKDKSLKTCNCYCGERIYIPYEKRDVSHSVPKQSKNI